MSRFIVLHTGISSDTGFSKFHRGLEVYERNVGTPHPLSASNPVEKRATAANPLVMVPGGNLWQGEVQIGTPPQNIRGKGPDPLHLVLCNLRSSRAVDFETGISDLWVPGLGCGTVCDGHSRYDPASSPSSLNLEKLFNWASADGSTVSGDLYEDIVRIGGVCALGQTIGVGNNISDSYYLLQHPVDGILGLGFQEMSTFNATPVFQKMIEQKQVDEPVFAIKLDDTDGSELLLGGVNKKLFKEPWFYSPIVTKVSLCSS